MAYAVPSPGTDFGKELAKWEMRPSRFTNDDVPPGRANLPFQEYPRMVYRAVKHPTTLQMVCMSVPPNPLHYATAHAYDVAMRQTEDFNRQCSRTVKDDVEFRNAKNEGWVESPALALEQHENKHWENVVEATAKRHYADRGMTAQAKAEAAAIDNSTEHQVPDVQVERARRDAKERR